MSNEKYSDILGIRQNFDDTYNIEKEKPDSWKSFITNAQFEQNLKSIVRSLSSTVDANNRKSIWIQGTYGTGKSHSTAVVKHLLCDEVDDIKDFVSSISDIQLRHELLSYRANHRVFSVVLKGRYTINDVKDMAYVIQQGTRNALEEQGLLSKISIKSDYEKAIEVLDDEMFESFWKHLLENELSVYCHDLGDIRKELKAYNREILSIIDQKFKERTSASFGTTSIVTWLKEVKDQLATNGIADSLIVFWDEFTSLLNGPESRSFLNTIQDIAELSKTNDENGNPENVYILLVSHKLFEQTDAYKQKDAEERKLAMDRFVLCKYEMQPNTTYHILSSTYNRKNEAALNELILKRVKSNFVISNLIDRIADNSTANVEEIKEKIISLYPFHPYTAYLSTFVSRQLGASERSIFNFVNDEKVGLKKFLTFNIDQNLFLLPDSIWDFYLSINTTSNINKLNEIINKYNLHFDDVKKKGNKYLRVFKTVLLLNSLSSVVDADETVEERSLVIPSAKNICDCYSGVYTQEDVSEILSYLDDHNIVVKTTDGIYEVSTSSVSQTELREQKKSALQNFNEITKVFDEYPSTLDDLRKLVITNNSLTVRKVDWIHLSGTLKNSQIDTQLENKIIDKSIFYAVLFFFHGECESLASQTVKERQIEDIKKAALERSKKYPNAVFACVTTELGDQEFERFVDAYAKSRVLSKGNGGDSDVEKKRAIQRISQWTQRIKNEGEIYSCFNGNGEYVNANTLANKICTKYIPFVFDCGLDKLSKLKKLPVWKEGTNKPSVEAFLFNTDRSVIESKLSGGVQSNLKPLLKDEQDKMYIFDESMKFNANASSKHPLVQMVNEVNKRMSDRSMNVIDLYDRLSFIFEPPYGYYGNPISNAALAIALRGYVDKLFTANTGKKIDKTLMRDIVEAIFKKNQGKKVSAELLNVRFSSQEELDLIEKLNMIFGLNEDGLVAVKWKIRDTLKKECDAPIWALKSIKKDISNELQKAVDRLFNFTVKKDDNISQSEISDLLTHINKVDTDLIKLYTDAKTSGQDLVGCFIQEKYQGLVSGESLDENELKDYKAYVRQHIQDDVVYWTESDITVKISECYASKVAASQYVSNDQSTYVAEPAVDYETVSPVNPVKPAQETGLTKAEMTLEKYDGDPKRLTSLIKKILDRYPDIWEIVVDELK